MYTKFSSLKYKESKWLEGLSAGSRVMLKMVLEIGCGLDSSESGYCSLMSSCEHGNGYYTAGWEFLDRLSSEDVSSSLELHVLRLVRSETYCLIRMTF
jgi:hypothetical protein